MIKKAPYIFLVGVVAIGAFFAVAKFKPCLAQEKTCSSSTKTFSSEENVPIINYSPEAVQTALDAQKRPVLFFQASWCSTCYLIEKNFQEHAEEIPSDVVMFRVNMDTNKELNATYNVVAPDEFVQINAQKDEISHWKSSEQAVKELLRHLK